jgi:hypothetical protein
MERQRERSRRREREVEERTQGREREAEWREYKGECVACACCGFPKDEQTERKEKNIQDVTALIRPLQNC